MDKELKAIRGEYIKNHIEWFLKNHPDATEEFMREVRHKYDAKTRDSKQTALPELPEILEPLDLSKMTEAELSDELEKGLEDMKAGRVMTAEKAFDGIRARL